MRNLRIKIKMGFCNLEGCSCRYVFARPISGYSHEGSTLVQEGVSGISNRTARVGLKKVMGASARDLRKMQRNTRRITRMPNNALDKAFAKVNVTSVTLNPLGGVFDTRYGTRVLVPRRTMIIGEDSRSPMVQKLGDLYDDALLDELFANE